MSFPRVSHRSSFVIDPLQDKRWSQLVHRHPASSVFHSVAWLSALRAAYDYKPVVYTFCEPSSELTSGLAFCEVESWLTGRRLVSLPFSDHCDPLVETATDFDNLLSAVRDRVDGGKWDYCEVRPTSLQPGTSTKLQQSTQYFLHAIDLRPSLGAIYRKFHKNSVQRKIRRAERDDLRYEEGNSDRLLEHFSKLLLLTRKRQQLPPQPIKWFRSLMQTFGDNLRIRVAFKNSTPIASILTLNHKNAVIYKYGCSDVRWHPSGGMALLLWNTIQQAKAAGYESFDLGRSDIDHTGLIAFKDRWGATRSSLRYWRYPNRALSHEYLEKRAFVGRIINASPDRLLSAVGNLFYRHIA